MRIVLVFTGSNPYAVTQSPSGQCQDSIPNCDQYDSGVCTDPQYRQWVLTNCIKTCQLCGMYIHMFYFYVVERRGDHFSVVNLSIYLSIHLSVSHVCVHAWVRACMSVCVCKPALACVHVYIHMCVCAHMCACVCVSGCVLEHSCYVIRKCNFYNQNNCFIHKFCFQLYLTCGTSTCPVWEGLVSKASSQINNPLQAYR